MQPGKPEREDYHYSKHGSCALLLAFEPHTGRRWAKVYERRSAQEYTQFMQHLSQQFPEADVIELVQDNLNTHQGGSFYAHLPPEDAFALSQHFEMHFTPKGASWLNMVELEFSALSKQCLDRRIPCQRQLEHEVLAWVETRNAKRTTVTWQFSIANARDKLQRHYQKCLKS
jgi:predicted AAA+ superfamily ATPase